VVWNVILNSSPPHGFSSFKAVKAQGIASEFQVQYCARILGATTAAEQFPYHPRDIICYRY
jgi:hypothetical protein